MNFTSKQIWLINYPVMMSVLVEQLINITDAIFLGHVGETELGASAIVVEIQRGGMGLIRVTDNGCGIRVQSRLASNDRPSKR